MRYDLLAQDALRGVVRLALKRVARDGLPGEHHFFIAIDTRNPGVDISPRLKSKYPDEITIVLQHQFWNLEVREEGFSVDLSFDNVPERLVVPFVAVKGFFDPSVQFGLQFEAVLAPAQPESRPVPPLAEPLPSLAEAPEAAREHEPPAKVVSLDTFRKK
jgi:hypothetical protein